MLREVTRVALGLCVALAVGCTTQVINLAASDGAPAPGPPADGGRPTTDAGDDVASTLDVAPSADAVGTVDAADDGSAAEFQRAYDAGFVNAAAHYVQFKCCVPQDSTICTEPLLGGGDVCLDPAAWKARAYTQCETLGLTLTEYWLYGACGSAAAP